MRLCKLSLSIFRDMVMVLKVAGGRMPQITGILFSHSFEHTGITACCHGLTYLATATWYQKVSFRMLLYTSMCALTPTSPVQICREYDKAWNSLAEANQLQKLSSDYNPEHDAALVKVSPPGKIKIYY